jgi:hypothetical protein
VWHAERRQPTFARVYIGDGNALDLVSLHVTVTVEGCRARTLVDHIFYNPHDRRLEGTFEYPLPTGASPSYFAMFLGRTRETVPPRFAPGGEILREDALARLTPQQLVKHVSTSDWGPLREARIVSREKALETYEEIVRSQIDPALLEYAAGNTFRGRVFPIPPKGYNRVLIAYEELLPFAGDRVLYRFPLPGCKIEEMRFSLAAATADCTEPVFLPKDARKNITGSQLAFVRTWKNTKPQGQVTFAFTPPQPRVQAISGRQGAGGPVYVYARVRPKLAAVENSRPFARHAVFLLDTSLSEHCGRFDISMALLRKILETDPGIRQFNVLTFNAGAAWVEPRGWLANTAAGRKKALSRLDGILLEGATDLSAALNVLAQPGFAVAKGTPLNVFLLSDGQITWGEDNIASLVARFRRDCPFPTRFHCYRTGLGAENLELFEALTRTGGGVFNCFGEADLPAAARAHRRQCMQVERVAFKGGPAARDVLVAGRRAAVYPGGDLIVAARVKGAGRTKLVVEGTFLGRKLVQEFPLRITGAGELAPRGWGEIAVAGLLELNHPKLGPLVTAYCQQFGIGSRVASFLVVETDNDYRRFNVDTERGKTVPGDLGRFLQATWRALGKPASARDIFERALALLDARCKIRGGDTGKYLTALLALLRDNDFELPPAPLGGAILSGKDVPRVYQAALQDAQPDVAAFLVEAQRRRAAGDRDGAVRALSSVVEEYPGRGDAVRLVGYRLLDMGQAGHAAGLFRQVVRQRPFEPHSYRDLARSLEDVGHYPLAAVQYEIVLAGTWHPRFHESLKEVAREEYVHMMREALQRKAVSGPVAEFFGRRLEQMVSGQTESDLRVTISWNTDATDVDLWVIEPDGTRCYYQQPRTKNGGTLSQDQTQGFGPERYRVGRAMPGVYRVVVHYFSPNPNLLAGETHVNVVVARHEGTPREEVRRYTVVLKQHGQEVEVCKVKF